MNKINLNSILMHTPNVTKNFVVRQYIQAGVLPTALRYNVTERYRQLLQHYRGPASNRARVVADWLVDNIDTVRESMRRREFSRQIYNSALNIDTDVQSERIQRLEDERQWVFDLTQETERQKKAKEIEDAKALEDAIVQEYEIGRAHV